MRLTGAILCNYAEVRDGLLTIVGGGINRLWRPELPGPLGCFLAMTIEVPAAELEVPHEVQIEITGPGGAAVGSLRGGFQLGAVEIEADETPTACLAFDLRPVGVALAGHHEVAITLDSDPAGMVGFRVLNRAPPNAPVGPAEPTDGAPWGRRPN